ncbi:hypothetical protein Patl1_05245 [Pistacia atlantica]|uniref:Uncharacterized protein n=1 Tax=Pistacia atlantica TaxID=434234 RepID=A0ACC1BSJ5_9ROSI|nr:hypothetical protein Patl1_05245 [Pistacia atlantica]
MQAKLGEVMARHVELNLMFAIQDHHIHSIRQRLASVEATSKSLMKKRILFRMPSLDSSSSELDVQLSPPL